MFFSLSLDFLDLEFEEWPVGEIMSNGAGFQREIQVKQSMEKIGMNSSEKGLCDLSTGHGVVCEQYQFN